MSYPQPHMNALGKGIAAIGLILFVVGLFGTAQCQTRNVSFFSDEEETECLALVDLDPFEEGDDASWEAWIIRNNFALLLIGTLVGTFTALGSDNRFAMLIAGLGATAVAGMTYIDLSIITSNNESLSLEWAWLPLLAGVVALVISALPSDPPYVATTESDSLPTASPASIHTQPEPPVPPSLEARSARTTARILAGIGIFILLFGGTFAPAFCNDEAFSIDCGIGGDGSFFDDEAFDESFEDGIQQNYISIIIVLLGGIAIFAAIAQKPLGVTVSGWTALGFLVMLYLYFWAIASAGEDSVFDYTKWGWIGLFGGPILLLIAGSRFRRAEDESIRDSWRQTRPSDAAVAPPAGSFSSSSSTWATPTTETPESNVETADESSTDTPSEPASADESNAKPDDDPSATNKTPI